MLTFAVGDVHGRIDLLDALLARIAVRAEGRSRRLVFLGDYIDRGPDSAGVLSRLRALQAAEPDGSVICLLGNHEAMLLDAVADPRRERLWLANGGLLTLASFWAERASTLPAETLRWIAACPRLFDDGRRLFVHAGLDPASSVADQRQDDLVWIREPFLTGDHDFGRYVVHGHTPCLDGRPEIRRHRLNIDTAAVFGGRLTAAIFDDERAEALDFLQEPR